MRMMFEVLQVTWGAFCLYAMNHVLSSVPKELTLLQIQDYIAFSWLVLMVLGALFIVAVARIYSLNQQLKNKRIV